MKVLTNEESVVAKPFTKVDIKHIPNDSEPQIKNWIRQRKKHIVYGSSAMATRSFVARQPHDLDLVVDSPRTAAQAFSRILRAKGHTVRVVPDPKWGAYAVQVKQPSGRYEVAADIHPIKRFEGKYDFYGASLPPIPKNGINLQRAADQLLRKGNAIMTTNAPHRELKDTADFVATAKQLVASMEVRSDADQVRIREVKSAIGVWERHLKSLKGSKAVIGTVKRQPLTDTKRKKFVCAAKKRLETDVDNIAFESGTNVKPREKPLATLLTPAGKIYSPYAAKPKRKRRTRTKSYRPPQVRGLAGVARDIMRGLRLR